jgi:MoaA/NifB/PqqE/SkfB family radical SAM enzyme
MITADIGVLLVNNMCTLKCKKCITLTPYQKNPVNYKLENLKKDIDGFFEIFDTCNHFDIEGGETLLHPDIAEIVRCALKYKDRFKYIALLTNGTLTPKKELLEICKGEKIFFIIDDYGEALSVKKPQLEALLREYNIEYRVDAYNGENQYYGGWIDFGDYSLKNYTNDELTAKFNKCRTGKDLPYIKDGKIYPCTVQALGIAHIPLLSGEYIDLRDSSKTIAQKREMAEGFFKKPVEHCKYCGGFLVDGPRIPAAEQFKDEELTADMKFCE